MKAHRHEPTVEGLDHSQSELVHTIEGINRLPYVFKGDAKCICCCNA